MKIIHNGITRLASLCRISLQVIEKRMYLPGYEPLEEDETVIIPDQWIIKLNPDTFMPCLGEEEGTYYLTQRGWNDNKDSIKMVYEKSMKFNPYTTEENTWEAFEKHAQEHFKKIQDNAHYPISKMKK